MAKLLDDVRVELQIVIKAEARISLNQSSDAPLIGFKVESGPATALADLQSTLDRHPGFFKSGDIKVVDNEKDTQTP